jgi:hypothetical protein
MQGKIVRQLEPAQSIFVGDLPSGTYWIRAQINGKVEQQRFVRL